jgi:hypothetical protein
LTVADNEKIEATKHLLFFGMLVLSVWVALGSFAVWLVNQLIGYLFLGLSAFLLLIVIRRLLCNSCYYCKSCTKGFAKLSKLTLGSNHIPGIGKGSTFGMAITIYVFLTGIPAFLLINSMLSNFSLTKTVLLLTIVAITLYTLSVRARNKY